MPNPRNFWERVDVGEPDECWPWRGYRSPKGHGRLTRARRSRFAHHVAWEERRGERTPGTVLHHTCENPGCCNPNHLEEVTPQEHKDRHHKTHCRRGHELTPDNIYWWRGKRKLYRKCRTCALMKAREREARKE